MSNDVSNPLFFFGTNLKMHQTARETSAFFDGLQIELEPVERRTRLFVIPPFTSLPGVAHHPVRRRVWLGAQNMHWADSGAYTGEISPPMLADLGVDLVLLGHAERRAFAGETDENINRKVLSALEHGLRVLVCIGESVEERSFEVGAETVLRQLKIALNGVERKSRDRVIVAYEPVWSIGEHGTPARPDEVRGIIVAMRDFLRERFGSESGPSILYGGSVDTHNCGAFAAMTELNGLFVGRAAWTVQGFMATLTEAERVRFGD